MFAFNFSISVQAFCIWNGEWNGDTHSVRYLCAPTVAPTLCAGCDGRDGRVCGVCRAFYALPEGTTNNSQLCAKHTTRTRDKCAEYSGRDTNHHRSGVHNLYARRTPLRTCLEHRMRLCVLQDISLLLTIMLYRVKMLWHCGAKRSVC